jgi:exonuclease SbcC
MKLKSLRMQNFFSHKDSFIDFDNVDSITMITGQIEGDARRSNGSGKTAILEAILYAIYEKTRLTDNKNATLDDMVCWYGDGKLSVELQFELNGHLYRIIRTRDKNKQKSTVVFEAFSASKWKAQTEAKKNDTNKDIVKLIGIDYKTFCSSICFQQTEVDKFVSATETERKAIIKNILQLDKYDEYSKSAKVKGAVAETKLVNIEQLLNGANVNVLDIDIKKKELIESEKKVDLLTIQKQAIESQVEKLRKQQILFNEQVEKRSSLINQLKDRKDTTTRLIAQVALAVSKQEDYGKIYEAKKQDFKTLQTKFELIKDQFIIEKQEILKDGRAADVSLKASEKDLEITSEAHHKLNGDIERIDRDIKSIQKLEAARCPTCFHQISIESKSSSLEFLDAHRKLLFLRAAEATARYGEVKQVVEINKKALEDIKERLQEYSKWAKEKMHLQDTMKHVKEAATEAKLIIEDQRSITKENQGIIEEYSKDITKLEDDISNISFDSAKFEELNKKISEKSVDLTDSNRLLTDAQIQKGRTSAELRQYESNLEKVKKYKEERDILLKEKFHYDELVKVFGKEIPTLIIENACFELGEEANKVLNAISGDSLEFVTQRTNKDGSMKEVFEIEITRPGVSHPVLIDSLSNGQKFRVVFAIRIALSRLLVRRRSSTSMEFLFYDECFASLDEKGIDDVIDVFRYLKNEFAHQLIITHGTNLKDRFGDNIIVVNQNNQGISKVAV